MKSQRYIQWFESAPKAWEYETVKEQEPPRPRYILWVAGGRALVDGEMLALSEVGDYLIFNDDCVNSFNLAVESPEMAIAIAKRITGCSMLGLVELEDDGEYHEWYDDEGREIEELAEPITSRIGA